MARVKVGLALGSGSARGWAHIGVIEALAEAGIAIDVIAGCSIGSLVGGALAAGQLDGLKTFAMSLTWREIARLTDVKLTTGGLVGGHEVVALLNRLGLSCTIESLGTPYVAVATDLGTGRETWLKEGLLSEAVRASISLPGIFSPASREGRWLVDGGLVNPVPVSACRALGADVVIAVNLNGDLVGRYGVPREAAAAPAAPEFLSRLIEQMPLMLRTPAENVLPRLLDPAPNTPGYFEVLMGSINIMQDQITRARLAGDPPHIALTPRLEGIKMLEFNRASEAIAEGRACVAHALPFIKRYL